MCCKNVWKGIVVFGLTFAFGFSGSNVFDLKSSNNFVQENIQKTVCTNESKEDISDDKMVKVPCEIDSQIYRTKPQINESSELPSLNCQNEPSPLIQTPAELDIRIKKNTKITKQKNIKGKELAEASEKVEKSVPEDKLLQDSSGENDGLSDLLYRQKCR